ncbi:MAG: IPT/TIG domain-containing protein [Treponema sp.]|nr:IPT/TIG domain-containing protein [Treponema sp.]
MMKIVSQKAFPLFCGIILCMGLLAACAGGEAPEITSIYPRIGLMGEPLVIRGSGFGSERNESYVTIAGTPPTSSSYLSWSDQEIVVRIPEFGDAGLIRVHRGRTKSNPVLFANQAALPERVSGEAADIGINPRIISVEPASGPVGSLITIQGSNFGSSRGNSSVFFSWSANPSILAVGTQDFVEVSGVEFGYEFWSDREIRVRVPDGAVSGDLIVSTQRGTSRPLNFDVTGTPGTRVLRDRRSYVLSYMVDVRIDQAATPNALYLWMPLPAVSGSQRNVRLIDRTAEPFVENHRGTSLFRFVDIPAQANTGVTLTYVVDVYAVETNITNQNPVRLNSPSPVGAFYTLASPLVPSDDAGIRARAAQIIGPERRPYAMARRIYDWILANIDIQAAPLPGGALEALEENAADSYRAALLFCALARAAGIPAIPVAGILINNVQGTIRHYWAEFWLDGFGWLPVDPALGAGAAPANFNLREDYARFYFGNMDNQRVAFSRGEHALSQMTPHGRTVQRIREHSLQNLWEEAAGGIESYSSLWSDVIITGIFH